MLEKREKITWNPCQTDANTTYPAVLVSSTTQCSLTTTQMKRLYVLALVSFLFLNFPWLMAFPPPTLTQEQFSGEAKERVEEELPEM